MASISSVISTVKSWVSNNLTKYLPLSGGKMTGNITYVHSGLSIGTNPSSAQYKAIHWTDNTGDSGNNHRLATVEYSCATDGTAGLTIGPYQYIANRASYNGSMLQMKITSGNTKSITWDGKSVVCVETWRSGTSWYRKYADGWIEQGGYVNKGTGYTSTTVSLITPVTSTNYFVSIESADGNWDYGHYVHSKITSSFICNNRQTTNYYWYACGY